MSKYTSVDSKGPDSRGTKYTNEKKTISAVTETDAPGQNQVLGAGEKKGSGSYVSGGE